MVDKKNIKRNLDFFLKYTDLSTYELADRFGIEEQDIAYQILEGSDKNDGK